MALLEVGRRDEARDWFGRAMDIYRDGLTDAADICAELDGVVFVDEAFDDDDSARDDVDPAEAPPETATGPASQA